MLKKHLILFGIIISMILFVVATSRYPGGYSFDKNSIGFSWMKNYISNLFGEKAVNGLPNSGRFWAVGAMMFLSASFASFFINFSKRIPLRGASLVIKYIGVIAMIFTFLVATPLHDIMVLMASTLFLVGIFYITVFVFRSKLHLFKFFCTVCMLIFYSTLFFYGAIQYREFLPIMQKVTFASMILLILGLHYFTKKEDFQLLTVKMNDEI